MTTQFAVNLDMDDRMLAESIVAGLHSIRQQVQGAMGEKFFEVVRSNFGVVGVDRPLAWVPLSSEYARKVKRPFATLYVTGALESAVKFDNSSPLQATVSVSDGDVPYATVHQFGGGNNIPARPYFPVTTAGDVTEFTSELCRAAAEEEIRRLLA